MLTILRMTHNARYLANCTGNCLGINGACAAGIGIDAVTRRATCA